MKRNKKLLIFLVLLLVAIGAGFSYAWFSVEITGNENASYVRVTTGSLSLLYEEGTKMSLDEAYPGSSIFKNFTVTNTGNVPTKYDIMWKDVFNEFEDKSDIQFTLTCSTDNVNGECKEQNIYKQVPNTTNIQEMMKSVDILPGETHSYRLGVYFIDTNDLQNDNQDKLLSLNVQINNYVNPQLTMNVSHGTISESAATVGYGESKTFTITPSSGYSLNDMTATCRENTNVTRVGNSLIVGPVYFSDVCNVEFAPVFLMTGYVVDNNDNPIINSNLEIHSEVKTTMTDSCGGYFEIPGIEEGEHELSISKNNSELHRSNFNMTKGTPYAVSGNNITTYVNNRVNVKLKIKSDSIKTITPVNSVRLKLIVNNGEASESCKIVESGSNISIPVSIDSGYSDETTPMIRCTNGVVGEYNSGVFNINNLTKSTECLVGFSSLVYEVALNTDSDYGSITKNVVYGETYGELITPSKPDYIFDGYYTSQTGGVKVTSSTIVNISSDHTLYARWIPAVCAVTYDCGENEGICSHGTIAVPYGNQVNLSLTGSKAGYVFKGWNTDKNATIGLDELYMDEEHKTLYAIYEKTINVIYDENGSILSKTSDGCVIYNKAFKCSFTSPSISRTGYLGVGFNINSSATIAQIGINALYETAESKTYYAITANNKYYIAYNANGGSGSMSNTLCTYDENCALSSNTFTKSYYAFNGWNSKADGTGTNYTNVVNNLTSENNATINLYAVWIPITYTVVYNCNGGGGNTPTTITQYSGLSFTLAPSSQCKYKVVSGTNGMVYSPTGWSTTLGGNEVYSDGQSVSNLTSINGGIVNLYAVYTPLFDYGTGLYKVTDEGSGNWNIELYTSKNITMNRSFALDIHVVGGGGGGGGTGLINYTGGGGGGGYTNTCSNKNVTANTNYYITIGAGGIGGVKKDGGDGGSSSFGSLCSANGGKGGAESIRWKGGNGGAGGSGGGAGSNNGARSGAGGSNGSSANQETNTNAGTAGVGQGSTTKDFGTGILRAGGGGGGNGYTSYAGAGGAGGGGTGGSYNTGGSGTDYYGGGGGGGGWIQHEADGGNGGCGIVIIRNKR